MGSFASLRRLRLTIAALSAVVAGTLLIAPHSAQAASPADHTLYWNSVLLQTFKAVGGPPTPLARAGAIMHGAMYDAANSALGGPNTKNALGQQYLLTVAGGGDMDTAIDYAAYNTLRQLFPTRDFQAQLTEAQSSIAPSSLTAAGQQIGTSVANSYIQTRAGDGSAAPMTYTPGSNPGDWRPTGSGPAVTPQWGNVTPFALSSGSQYRPAPPANATSTATLLTSSTYAQNFQDVKDLGAVNSTVRSAAQTQIAFFWANDTDGTYKPPGQLFDHTQTISKAQAVSKVGNVKLFAIVGFALADAGIAAWDAKYNTSIDLWRPETAIRQAANDNNPATAPDANWTPLLGFSPAFPAYISGHATFGGAWAAAMRYWFNTDNLAFTVGTDDPHVVGVKRSFASFSAAATENARSRIYLGVHYQFDGDSGVATGTKVGDHVANNKVLPNQGYVLAGAYGPQSKCINYGSQATFKEHRWESFTCEEIPSQPGVYNLYLL